MLGRSNPAQWIHRKGGLCQGKKGFSIFGICCLCGMEKGNRLWSRLKYPFSVPFHPNKGSKFCNWLRETELEAGTHSPLTVSGITILWGLWNLVTVKIELNYCDGERNSFCFGWYCSYVIPAAGFVFLGVLFRGHLYSDTFIAFLNIKSLVVGSCSRISTWSGHGTYFIQTCWY